MVLVVDYLVKIFDTQKKLTWTGNRKQLFLPNIAIYVYN
jgi:hypothetical protein